MNKIERFKFEITPWSYVTGESGTSQLLSIEVTVNGRVQAYSKAIDLLDTVQPYMSQLEFYAHVAVENIKDRMIEMEKH